MRVQSCKDRLEKVQSFADIFEIVKAVVTETTGNSRGGLGLSVAELGNSSGSWLGGYYPAGSNINVQRHL